jgi:uncharacterized protein GlcG (DUF336 family)
MTLIVVRAAWMPKRQWILFFMLSVHCVGIAIYSIDTNFYIPVLVDGYIIPFRPRVRSAFSMDLNGKITKEQLVIGKKQANIRKEVIVQSLGNDYLQQISLPYSLSQPLSASSLSYVSPDSSSYQRSHQQQQQQQQPLLISSQTFSLSIADEIATKALTVCAKNGFAPMAVSIVDTSGHVIVSKRMDNCPVGATNMAHAKALTCIQLHYSSRAYGTKYLSQQATPDAYVRLINQLMILSHTSPLGSVAAFPGGVLVRNSNSGTAGGSNNCIQNPVIGAVGISGGAGDEDEYCALAAIHSSSIGSLVVTDPLNHSCQTIKK